MAQSIDVLQSDLYQNGKVIELDNGDRVLFRERYAAVGLPGDTVKNVNKGQDLRLLAFLQYNQTDSRPEGWWWLLSDRNAVFNPIFNEGIGEDGALVDYTDRPVLIPNLLKQKVRL